MMRHHMLIPEDRDSCDHMHVQSMDISCELRNTPKWDALRLRCQSVFEWNAQGAITVFNIDNYRVSTPCAPATNDRQPLFAARHSSRQVDSSHLEVSWRMPRLF